jgi:hypothetical protein
MTVSQMALDPGAATFTGGGMTQEAISIQNGLLWFRDRLFGDVVAYVDQHRNTLREIEEAFDACSADGWDGYGARGVDPRSYAYAREFLLSLPTTAPDAEITVEPDGEIAFEWYSSPTMVFTVSIGRDRKLTYAGRFGRVRASGVEYFEDEIPRGILTNISRVRFF